MSGILVRLAFAGIRRRLLASFLTVLLSAVVAATVVLALEVGSTARDPWQRTFDAAHGADVLALVPTEAEAKAIADRPAVSEASAPVPSTLARIQDGDQLVAVQLAGIDGRPRVNAPVSTEGVAPGGEGVVLELSFAEALGLEPGSRIRLSDEGRAVDLVVGGTAVLPSQARYPRSKPGLAWVDRATLRQVAPNTTSWHWAVAVRLRDPGVADAFAARVGSSFRAGEAGISTREDQRTEALLDAQPITLIVTAYAVVLLVVALAVAVILVGARAREQYREIGLLKAVGHTPRQVGRVFAIETAVLGVVGVLLGFAVGALLAPLLAAPSSTTMLGSPTVVANPWHALVAAVPVLLVLLVGTWSATRRRAALSVVNAIRAGSDAPPSRSVLVRAIGRFAPSVPADLGLRNLVAVWGRALMLVCALVATGSAVVFALSMQASLDARPAGEVSDVPDELPMLVYTLDVLLIVIAVMSLAAVALLSVRERTREFGILKTLGFTPRQVTNSLVSGHALVALLAGLLSLPVGLALYVVVYAASGGSSEDRVIAPWWWLGLAVLGLVLLAVVAISLPARFATRVRIADALRYE
jgi:putative ABC transport system permease protein